MPFVLGTPRAHTLVELLAVLLLVAILASVAAPVVARSSRRYAASTAARELRADLIAARTRAILDGGTVRVAIDTVAAQYRVISASGDTVRGRKLSPGLFLGTTATRQEILFTARGTSSLYSTTWIGVVDDPGARWHATRVAPTGAVIPL